MVPPGSPVQRHHGSECSAAGSGWCYTAAIRRHFESDSWTVDYFFANYAVNYAVDYAVGEADDSGEDDDAHDADAVVGQSAGEAAGEAAGVGIRTPDAG